MVASRHWLESVFGSGMEGVKNQINALGIYGEGTFVQVIQLLHHYFTNAMSFIR